MTRTISIADGLKLPLDTVVQRKLVVAKNRAGKSNTACVYVEETLDHGIQVIIIDPKGDWYGLRSSSDGQASGYPALIMGGDHGDIPLSHEAGAMLGRYFGSNNVSAVLDVSDLTKSKMRRFCADFLEALYDTKKKNRDSVLLLVIEEADELAPQKIQPYMGPDAPRCLGMMEQIAKRGGFLGLGLLCITQRWASLSKDITTQTDVMIVMRITAPQDMKAGDEWFREQDPAKREEVQKNLQSLKVGEGFVWVPDIGLFERVRFRRRKTYDSGYTPKVGESRVEPKVLARVELEALKGEMASFVEQVRADDPKTLKARIRDLEKQLATRPDVKVEVRVERQEVPVVIGDAEAIRLAATNLSRMLGDFLQASAKFEHHRTLPPPRMVERADRPKSYISPPIPIDISTGMGHINGRHIHQPDTEIVERTTEQRVLDALAELEALGISATLRPLVGLFSGYTNPRSGAFTEALAALHQGGHVSFPSAGLVALTNDGRKRAMRPPEPLDSVALRARFAFLLGDPCGKIISTLTSHRHPNGLSRPDLGTVIGYTNPRSGAFTEALAKLASLGLIEYPAPGIVKASDKLFLSEARTSR